MNISYGQIGVIIAVIAHAVATIWWAATMTANLRGVRDEVARLNNELTKRDVQIESLGKRFDELKEKLWTAK